ncbi:hypothetical protein [Methanoregula sp.]|uniref:hypothetical protein n=1 Tax=Methanoregula sp. TaxID=2052170 RepID=UPI002637C2F4|nr:hypothetical protein [Methanoregula sp.]MDD5143309.1 hypothetical protein [Methanoregula sp.]
MEWIIVLKGDEHDLDDLSKVYYSPDLTIKKILENDHSYYALTSTQFLLSLPYVSVKEIAQNIVRDFTAGTILLRNSRRPIEIEYITQVDETGKKAVFLEATISATSSVYANLSVGRRDGSVETHNAAEPIVRWLSIKQKDKNVAKVFEYINHDFGSSQTRYKIYEIIKADGFTPLQKDEKYWKKAELFRRSMNNPLSSGLDSRHALDTAPPKKPMTLSESQDFIKMLIQEWLNAKDSNSSN